MPIDGGSADTRAGGDRLMRHSLQAAFREQRSGRRRHSLTAAQQARISANFQPLTLCRTVSAFGGPLVGAAVELGSVAMRRIGFPLSAAAQFHLGGALSRAGARLSLAAPCMASTHSYERT